jgi:hypothetical protein
MPLARSAEGDDMKATRVLVRFTYALFGTLFLASGATTLLVNTGVLPDALRTVVVEFSRGDPGTLHIIQELGSLLVLVGLLTFWFLWHYERSMVFHWAFTAYWAIMAVIHWFNVAGPNPSITGPLVNTIPFAVFALLGVLRLATETAQPTERAVLSRG